MTKSTSAEAETRDEAGILKSFVPVQEGLERLHQVSEKLSSTYKEIATHQMAFLQHTVFDALTELQSLSRTHNPAEFIEKGTEFAWLQAERSFKALGELGKDVSDCWFAALKSLPEVKTGKSRPLH